MRRRHELPFGAELAAGGVRFRLWAPRAATVALSLEKPEHSAALQIQMQPEPGGWWSLTTCDAGPGSRYRYLVGGTPFPDPASRYQPEGVHGTSEVVDPAGYAWSDTSWHGRSWEELTIYELHVGAFSEAGDYSGVAAHLDHLVKLGVTAIELMPLAEFPGERNWGYDGVQLYAPSSRYGRPEDLKRLVEACHARGVAVLLDVVYNHFGPEGNCLHSIAPDFFTERHHTPWGAAINYDGPQSRPVRDFMIHNALYWLEEFHFDGLRLDAVHAIVDDGQPDIVTEIAETVRQRITDRPVHLVLENDQNEARRLVRCGGRPVFATAQWNDDLHHALHVLTTGETNGYYADYADRPAAHLGRILATGFAYQGEPSPFRNGRRRGEPSDKLPAAAFVSFLQNHDQVGNRPMGDRIAALAPEPLVHAAVAIVLLSPQIPLLFMGEEWASGRPFPFFCDFAAPLDEAVRRGRRREFALFPEFGNPSAQERIPDATAEATFAMARLDWSKLSQEPHARWLRRYRHLLALRAREIAPRLPGMAAGGSYRLVGPLALWVEWRLGDGSTLRLLANFADAAAAAAEPPASSVLLYCTAERTSAGEIAAHSAMFHLLADGSAAE